jgi:hypothetical protein
MFSGADLVYLEPMQAEIQRHDLQGRPLRRAMARALQ